MTDLKACREAFEKWMLADGEAYFGRPDFRTGEAGEYEEMETYEAWFAWQAACEWMNTRAAKGEAVAWILRTGHGIGFHEGGTAPVENVGWEPLYTQPPRATSVNVEPLKALVKTWRENVTDITLNRVEFDNTSFDMWICADELEAVIAQRGEADNGHDKD